MAWHPRVTRTTVIVRIEVADNEVILKTISNNVCIVLSLEAAGDHCFDAGLDRLVLVSRILIPCRPCVGNARNIFFGFEARTSADIFAPHIEVVVPSTHTKL